MGHVKLKSRFRSAEQLHDTTFGWTNHTDRSLCHELHCTASAAASAANERVLQFDQSHA